MDKCKSELHPALWIIIVPGAILALGALIMGVVALCEVTARNVAGGQGWW